MDTQKLNDILNQVFLEVLEQHAFLLPEPADPGQPLTADAFSDSDFLQIEMEVRGALEGCFLFILPTALCAEIESNLTGKPGDASPGPDTDGDGAKEILNIVGANVITSALGSDASFEISVPRSRPFVVDDWNHLGHLPLRAQLLVDGKPVFLLFNKKGAP